MVLERTRLQRNTFLVLFIVAAYLFLRTLEPIWVPVFLGLTIAVGTYPLQQRLEKKLHSRGLPAALLTGAVLTAFILLGVFIVFVVGHRALEFAQEAAKRYQQKGTVGLLGNDVMRLLSRLGLNRDDVQQRVAQTAEEVASYLGKGATTVLTGTLTAIFILVFTAITSYYLLREAPEGVQWLVEIIPLPNGQVSEIVHDVRDVTRAILLSTGLVSGYQALASGIGYWIFGVDSPIVWASLTGIASIMPGLGSALVWVPIGIVMVALGHPAKGIGILVFCAVAVVGFADYVLRPKLVGTKIKMNDLLVFVAIFGGIEAFGVLGLLVGPIAVAILLSLIRIYQRDYRPEGPVQAPDVTKPSAEPPQTTP